MAYAPTFVAVAAIKALTTDGAWLYAFEPCVQRELCKLQARPTVKSAKAVKTTFE